MNPDYILVNDNYDVIEAFAEPKIDTTLTKCCIRSDRVVLGITVRNRALIPLIAALNIDEYADQWRIIKGDAGDVD